MSLCSGWGYWPQPYSPPVDQWKWNDARHMTNVCDRWSQNHTNDLQDSYFNGVGFESWENVWGCWNGITPRDGEATRRAATILRYFGNRRHNAEARNFTQSGDWRPYIPVVAEQKYWSTLFASEFPVDKGTATQQVLFLVVNRDDRDVQGAHIAINNSFAIAADKIHIYDCYHGQELAVDTSSPGTLGVSLDIEGLGYGALLATYDSREDNPALDELLNTMHDLTQTPLSAYSSQWKYLEQTSLVVTEKLSTEKH